MMMLITDKQLYGLKFYGENDYELLKVDCQLCQEWQESNDLILVSVDLEIGERLVGVKSTGKDFEKAFQCEFEFLIGKEY